ncbi:MAG TPA: Gfo/Idh/MocA family oxidoreductase [Candidatus Hydrogenedentes bacterium]|nr:Gfo/Idh/MocA family oxidoreductase [Candidatus Hydrogenedentota bacterium]
MDKKHAGGITRREFAKASALASFAVLSAKPSAAQSKEALKIGLIGCGGRGSDAVKNNLSGNDNVKIVALADVFEDRLQSARKNMEKRSGNLKVKVDIKDDHCFVGLDAYKKILETDVDIIIHATPPYARPMHIMAAVQAGKHVFTEKPIATDAPGVRMFVDAVNLAKEKKLSFVTGTQRRHQKSYMDTIKQIHDGVLGELLYARAYWNGTLPFAHERQPEWKSDLEYRLRNWYNQIWTCGDNIVEQHIHNLDVCNWAMKAHPIKVVASGGRAWKPKEEKYGNIWDNFSCDFEYANGAHMFSFSRQWNDSKIDVWEEVVGTKGKSNCRDMAKDEKSEMEQEHIDLVKSITGETPYLNTGIETAESTLTAIMGRMAAYTGQEITWEQAWNDNEKLVPDDLDWNKPYPLGPIPVPGKKA